MGPFWVVFSLVFLFLEIISQALVSIWFVMGGVSAYIAMRLGASTPVQLILCSVVSLLGIVFWWLVIKEKIHTTKTNEDRNIGQVGIVLQDIQGIEGRGVVVLGKERWTAEGENQYTIIPKGTKVEVIGIEGCHLIVREIQK